MTRGNGKPYDAAKSRQALHQGELEPFSIVLIVERKKGLTTTMTDETKRTHPSFPDKI
jgi:hypothetical protein